MFYLLLKYLINSQHSVLLEVTVLSITTDLRTFIFREPLKQVRTMKYFIMSVI